MKRGAERQLTKDGGDDDEIEEIHDPQGFQKADEATLAKRQIRALPKRSLTASRPPSLNGLPPILASDVDKAEPTPQPKFSGFDGFGVASAPNPFTFSAAPSVASVPLHSAFDTTVGPAQLTPTPVSSFFGAPKPASSSDAFPPKPATSSPANETDATAFQYFKSLRGLNVSFLSAISAAVEKDPFCDVVNLVESYKNLRTTIQSEFDDSSKTLTTRDSGATNSVVLSGAKAPSEKTTSLFTMPKPSEAPLKPLPIGENGSKTNCFTFPAFMPPSSSVAAQLPFALAPKPSESPTPSVLTSEPPKSAFALGASDTTTSASSKSSTSGFSFTASSSMEITTSKSIAGSSGQGTESSSASSPPRLASAAPSFGSSSMPKFFDTAKPTHPFGTSDAAFKPTSVFGGSVFGSNNTTESCKPAPFNLIPTDSKDGSKVPIALFGNAMATSSSTSTNIFRPSSDKPVSAFGSAFQSGAFTTGKPAGSIGNPVGFGFGSSSVGDTTTSESSASGFMFGAPSAKPSEILFTPPMTDKSSDSTPQPEAEGNEGGEEDAAKLLPSHTHDEEGEGEEDEETTHVVKCKVYRLFKSEERSEWKDLGIGMFRLKKHKETSARRVLMRNSSTGRILVNFRIHESLKPTLAKTAISFVGYDNSTPTSFSVRVKTEGQAEDLKAALDREIAAVQAVSE